MRRFLPLILLVAACGSPPDRHDPQVPTVATSLAPVGWLLERLLEDDAVVVVLVAPGDNPHTWQPSDASTARIAAADLLVEIGIALEQAPWFEAVGEGRERLSLGAAEAGHHDAHPWTDPAWLRAAIPRLVPALQRLAPEAAESIAVRAAGLDARLETLDRELRAVLEPWNGRAFLVHHPAWGELAERYGLTQLAVETEGKDPLDAELGALAERVAAEHIRVLFVQPQLPRTAAAAVARALALEVEVLDPLAGDWDQGLLRAATAIARSFEPGRDGP